MLLSLNQLLILLLIFPPGPAPSCSVGHTSQWSIRSHCSAPSSVALAKCQCWDLGLLILLLNVAALSGEKGPDWSVNKALLWRMRELFEPAMSRHVPPATPLITADIMKPKNSIGLHFWDCHSVWSVSVEFFVLSNNIYLSFEAHTEGGGWLPGVEGVWYWWNMAGILKVFSLLNPFKL